MPAKKTITPKENRYTVPAVAARIDRLVDYEGSKVKAIASANIGGAFAIHGIKVVESQKGLFIQMPQSSYEKDGKKQYTDQFHPITADARNELNAAVMEAYEEKLSETEDESPEEQDEAAFSQKM